MYTPTYNRLIMRQYHIIIKTQELEKGLIQFTVAENSNQNGHAYL